MGERINFSSVQVISADESYREFSYQVKKVAEGAYITEIFGWEEERERDFHAGDWQQKRPEIITYDGKSIGTIYTSESDNYFEIGQFFILPEYQNKGIGSYLLKGFLEKADRLGLTARLRYLRNNPAQSLYKRNSFQVTGFDGTFYSAERKPNISSV